MDLERAVLHDLREQLDDLGVVSEAALRIEGGDGSNAVRLSIDKRSTRSCKILDAVRSADSCLSKHNWRSALDRSHTQLLQLLDGTAKTRATLLEGRRAAQCVDRVLDRQCGDLVVDGEVASGTAHDARSAREGARCSGVSALDERARVRLQTRCDCSGVLH